MSTDHPTCFLLKPVSGSVASPVSHRLRVSREKSSQTGSTKMALYSLTGNARSPLHAEPKHHRQAMELFSLEGPCTVRFPRLPQANAMRSATDDSAKAT